MEQHPWIDSEDYQTHPAYLACSPAERAQIDSFRRDGYLILEDTGIGETLVDEAVASLAGKYTGSATGYSGGGRLQDAWRRHPAVRRIATAPAVLKMLKTLYQKDPIPFQTLNFERGTQQRAHSDTIHFNSLPHGFMCGVWTALEDTDAENGPLFYYPGSQRLPVYHMEDLGLEPGAESYKGYEDRIESILEKGPYVSRQAHLKKGQALIWSSNIFHGGSAVLDPKRTRKSQVTHFYFPGCVYYTPLLSNPSKQIWRLRRVKDIRTGILLPRYNGLSNSVDKFNRLRQAIRKFLR